VPFAQSAALAAALLTAGVDVEFLPVEGGKHFWQGLEDTATVFEPAIAFVRRVTAD
jgi:dipeptidyl aminopeptidase/acylaminoacyl peptidase